MTPQQNLSRSSSTHSHIPQTTPSTISVVVPSQQLNGSSHGSSRSPNKNRSAPVSSATTVIVNGTSKSDLNGTSQRRWSAETSTSATDQSTPAAEKRRGQPPSAKRRASAPTAVIIGDSPNASPQPSSHHSSHGEISSTAPPAMQPQPSQKQQHQQQQQYQHQQQQQYQLQQQYQQQQLIHPMQPSGGQPPPLFPGASWVSGAPRQGMPHAGFAMAHATPHAMGAAFSASGRLQPFGGDLSHLPNSTARRRAALESSAANGAVEGSRVPRAPAPSSRYDEATTSPAPNHHPAPKKSEEAMQKPDRSPSPLPDTSALLGTAGKKPAADSSAPAKLSGSSAPSSQTEPVKRPSAPAPNVGLPSNRSADVSVASSLMFTPKLHSMDDNVIGSFSIVDGQRRISALPSFSGGSRSNLNVSRDAGPDEYSFIGTGNSLQQATFSEISRTKMGNNAPAMAKSPRRQHLKTEQIRSASPLVFDSVMLDASYTPAKDGSPLDVSSKVSYVYDSTLGGLRHSETASQCGHRQLDNDDSLAMWSFASKGALKDLPLISSKQQKEDEEKSEKYLVTASLSIASDEEASISPQSGNFSRVLSMFEGGRAGSANSFRKHNSATKKPAHGDRETSVVQSRMWGSSLMGDSVLGSPLKRVTGDYTFDDATRTVLTSGTASSSLPVVSSRGVGGGASGETAQHRATWSGSPRRRVGAHVGSGPLENGDSVLAWTGVSPLASTPLSDDQGSTVQVAERDVSGSKSNLFDQYHY